MALLAALCASGGPGPGPATGTLEIHYRLAGASGDLQPSYQTSIWLENSEGERVRSLLVSEWLAYSGHNHDGVCPTWQAVADWENVSEADFDAVTRATAPGSC